MNGWIKLHRSMLEWEWYDDPNVMRLWLHLLLKANHKSKRWRGVEINPGQLVTGRLVLSEETGLTEQQVRTALNKLKSTGEITSKIYSKFSLITITSWDKFQADNQQVNQQSTSNQPASNHKQECKKEKNVKKDNPKPNGSVSEVYEYWKSVMGKNGSTQLTKEREKNVLARLKDGYSVDDIKNAITGCSNSDFHMGREPGQPKQHNDLELICRSGTKLEGFWQFNNKTATGGDRW